MKTSEGGPEWPDLPVWLEWPKWPDWSEWPDGADWPDFSEWPESPLGPARIEAGAVKKALLEVIEDVVVEDDSFVETASLVFSVDTIFAAVISLAFDEDS